MLRFRMISSLIAMSTLGVFSLSALAQDAKPGDKKPAGKMAPATKKEGPKRGPDGKFIKADAKKDETKKEGPKRGPDGKFVKADTAGKPAEAGSKMAGGKMAGGSKMAPAAKSGDKPVWDAKANRWRLNGKFIKEEEALKLGGKK